MVPMRCPDTLEHVVNAAGDEAAVFGITNGAVASQVILTAEICR